MTQGGERQAVSLERLGPVAVLRFHNQPSGVMDEPTGRALEAAIVEFERDPCLRVAILTGAEDGMFILHYDVAELLSSGRRMAARGLRFSTDRPVPEAALHRALNALAGSAKPTLAAINGTAMGGGFEIALACDFRIAQRGPYRIGLPEVHVGLFPGAGGTQRLSTLVGPAAALEMLMFGLVYAPEDARRKGLVHRCADDALQCALEMAHELCTHPAATLAHIKRLVGLAGNTIRPDGFDAERTLFCDLLVSPDCQSAMQSQVEGSVDLGSLPCAPVSDT